LQQRRGAVNIEKAEDYYKRALQADPKHAKAHTALKQIMEILAQ